jgi:hypothetical protein
LCAINPTISIRYTSHQLSCCAVLVALDEFCAFCLSIPIRFRLVIYCVLLCHYSTLVTRLFVAHQLVNLLEAACGLSPLPAGRLCALPSRQQLLDRLTTNSNSLVAASNFCASCCTEASRVRSHERALPGYWNTGAQLFCSCLLVDTQFVVRGSSILLFAWAILQVHAIKYPQIYIFRVSYHLSKAIQAELVQ